MHHDNAETETLSGATESYEEFYKKWQDNEKDKDSKNISKVKPEFNILTAKDVLETEYPEVHWVIDKVLPEEGISLIVGEAGTFKSFFCLYLTRALITKEPFLGHFQVNRTCKILIIDKENKLRRLKKRMVAMNFPKSEDVFFLEYPERFRFENNQFVSFVSEFIKEKNIDLVIFDSFIDMFDGNENSSTDTAKAFDVIRNLDHNASYIAIHHDSKPIPKMVRSAAQKTRGSSNIIAQVDTQFYFEKGKDLKSFIVEQGKSRDEEPLKKFQVNIVSDLEKGLSGFEYAGEVKEEVTKIEETKELIYQFILERPYCTKDDITAELVNGGITERTGKRALLALEKTGLIDAVQKPGYGRKNFYFAQENERNDFN